MGRAIRFWCHAAKVLEGVAARGERAIKSRPSELGIALLADGGWDPYLEDPASLWYLHWKLVEAPSLATSWRYVFTLFPEIEFTPEQLQAALAAYVAQTFPTARAAETSLHKDVLCIIRMYTDMGSSAVSEETMVSPFADLGLIQPSDEARTFAFDVGEKAHLPELVLLAACLEYAAVAAPGARTISTGRLLYDPGSPGMAFKLSESGLTAAIERVAASTRAIALADTAGLVQLSYSANPTVLARELLSSYYAGTHDLKKVGSWERGVLR